MPNYPPVLAAISDRTIIAGQTLTFTNQATDSDVPPPPFTYSLLNAPDGATIDPNLGVFTWRPTIDQSPQQLSHERGGHGTRLAALERHAEFYCDGEPAGRIPASPTST